MIDFVDVTKINDNCDFLSVFSQIFGRTCVTVLSPPVAVKGHTEEGTKKETAAVPRWDRVGVIHAKNAH